MMCCTATRSLAIGFQEILHYLSGKTYASHGSCEQSTEVAANQFPRFHWVDSEISGVVRQPVESQAWPGKAEMQSFQWQGLSLYVYAELLLLTVEPNRYIAVRKEMGFSEKSQQGS